MNPDDHEVTALLQVWGEGDVSACDRLMPLVYRELRRWARVTLDGAPLATPPGDVDVLDLDIALTELARHDA